MIASNYECIEDGQKLYTLSEAKRELTRRTKAKRKSKAYKQRLLKQRVIGFTLLCAVLMFGVVGWYAITYMATPVLIWLICTNKVHLAV
ncbi:MAG: hypothetical protein ACLTY2_01420 [Coprococcus eutactus]